MACNEAVVAASLIISAELCVRLSSFAYPSSFQRNMDIAYMIFAVGSALSTLVSSLKFEFACNAWLEWFTPFLYMLDSLAAVALGVGLYSENLIVSVFSLVLLTNFFMLHILNRIFVAKKPKGLYDDMFATAKNFIHHTASFMFLNPANKETIVLTCIWRAISMSGHTAQSLNLKKLITPEMLHDFNWKLTHVRNVYVMIILVACCASSKVREGFAQSAVGHVGYILVRAGPVFRLGSVYVGDRPSWQSLSDWQRLKALVEGKHIFLTIEVGSLSLLACLFLYLKYFS